MKIYFSLLSIILSVFVISCDAKKKTTPDPNSVVNETPSPFLNSFDNIYKITGDPELDCGQGVGASCFTQGTLYERGTIIEKNLPKAQKFYQKSCDLGFKLGCYNLGIFLKTGTVIKDINSGNNIHKRSCSQGGKRSCAALGDSYEFGEGVKKNIDTSIFYFKKSCKMGFSRGCFKLGELLYRWKKSPEKALVFLNKACSMGYKGVRACIFASLVILVDRSTIGESSFERFSWKKEKLFTKFDAACKQGIWGGCNNAGLIVEKGADDTQVDLKRAFEFYKKGCDAHNPVSCNLLANLYRRGQYVSKNIDIAIKLYKKACSKGFPLACHDVGVLYFNGDGVKTDYKKAAMFFSRGCRKNYNSSCLFLITACTLGKKEFC
jgi:uncharacterized protein